MSDNESEETALRRSTRNRVKRDSNPCDYLDGEEEVDEEEDNQRPSVDSVRSMKPAADRWYEWQDKTNVDEYSTVDDSEKLVQLNNWSGRRYLLVRDIMSRAQKDLVIEQGQHTIALERSTFTGYRLNNNITQVPYHADLLPHWKYFAEGIQQHSELEAMRIVNHHLPPAPWLGENILPVLERNSNRMQWEGNMTSLQLSNCGLSGDDLTALVNFLSQNKTLRSLDISRNNIESIDTVKALAKAIKKHAALNHVGLANCSLGGGSHDILDKLLVACKGCDSLEIGHGDFDAKCVAMIAKFLGKKNALTSFALVGAPVDKESKKLLENALVKNKGIEQLCLRSNDMQLPGILRATNKVADSLSRLTHLDLSFNKLPISGAKVFAKWLEKAKSSLISLILSKNNLTTKGANILLPALKENTFLEKLDLSRNWLSDAVAPAVIDLLSDYPTLLSLDLSGNKSLRLETGRFERKDRKDGGRAQIIKSALFDRTSLKTSADSNHTCAVYMTGQNRGYSYEETIRRINALEVSEGQKIRYKVVLALNEAKKELYDQAAFSSLPLELMPYLLEMIQQELGVNGFGRDVLSASAWKSDRSFYRWTRDPETDRYEPTYVCDPTLNNLFEILSGWQSFPLLFNRGAGELPETKKKVAQKKKHSKSRKRKRFGDEDDDDDDEAWVPRGARTTARWEFNPITRKYERILPAAEFR